MKFRFHVRSLKRTYEEADFYDGRDKTIVKVFRRRIQMISAATDERDFRALKSLHFEKLKGDRSHQHSMMLNDQWRLILEFEGSSSEKMVVVMGIEDYH